MGRKIEVEQQVRVVRSDTYPDQAGQVGRVTEVSVWAAEDCIVTSIWLDFAPANHLSRGSVEFRLYHGPGGADRDVNILETYYE